MTPPPQNSSDISTSPHLKSHLGRGLYAITPECHNTEQLLTQCQAVLTGGAKVLQYRNKQGDQDLRLQQAQALNELCNDFAVPLIINDDVELCRAVNASGVHLGRDDEALLEARQQLGSSAIIGSSCYNDLARAQRAVDAQASYLAFGSCFVSSTKPQASRCEAHILREAAQRWSLPIVAIGGITAENGASLVGAGVDLLAVISDVFDADNITKRALQYQSIFTQ